jgi:hypothetical protein
MCNKIIVCFDNSKCFKVVTRNVLFYLNKKSKKSSDTLFDIHGKTTRDVQGIVILLKDMIFRSNLDVFQLKV